MYCRECGDEIFDCQCPNRKEYFRKKFADLEKQFDDLLNKKPTHEISACYFPGVGECEFTWEDIETGKRLHLTVKVDEKFGNEMVELVPACVYSKAVVKPDGN